jgi:hypothetical protein
MLDPMRPPYHIPSAVSSGRYKSRIHVLLLGIGSTSRSGQEDTMKRSQRIEMRTVINVSVEAERPQEYRRKNRPISRPLAWLFLCAGVALAQTASQDPNPCEIGFAPSLSLLEAATTVAVDQIAPESLRIRRKA